MKNISVLCHIFYKDSLNTLKPYLDNLREYNTTYFFNICSETDYCRHLIEEIHKNFEAPVITVSPNAGKDIGGKLILIDTHNKLGQTSDYLVLLHDKVSPHTSTGNTWREKLLSILKPDKIDWIMNEFSKNKSTGIVGSKYLVMNEYDENTATYECTSNTLLLDLRQEYAINTEKHEFIGGTMFWVRAVVYQKFFSTVNPLDIRATLEKGNISDHRNASKAHAWERMLSWIALQQGYNLKGI